jgi:PAS domain S-box-containing protein
VSLLRATLDSTTDGILVVDLAGQVSDFNQRFLQMWQIPVEVMRARDDKILLSFVLSQLKDPEAFLEGVKRRYAAPEEESFDVLEFKDGKLFERYSRPQRIEGRPVGRVWSFRDVSARRLADGELKKRESLFRALIETTGTGYVILDGEGRVLDANAEYVRLSGHSDLKEILNRSVVEWTAGHHKSRNAAAVQECMARGSVRNLEIDYVDSRGKFTPVEINATVVKSGDTLRILTLCRNITDRKAAEAEHRSLERQFQQAQKLESLGLLAGGIAHDLNNLLVGILGNADLLAAELQDHPGAKTGLGDIERAALSAAALCGQLLAYCGKGRFTVQAVDLSALAAEMSQMLEIAVSKKADLQYKFTHPLPAVEGDPSQIRQIIMNLITNASEALGDRPGTIAIGTGVVSCSRLFLSQCVLGEGLPEGQYAYFEVRDTGCGMDRETMAKMFDPFFTTKFTGRGLGLAGVLGIVRSHKGLIKVDSELNHGSTFRVMLPASTRPADMLEGEGAHADEWRGQGSILVIDDEEHVRVVAERILSRAGFSVLTAGDGRVALETFRRHADEIRGVILDLTMPEMSGEQVYEKLKEIGRDVPVLVSSGYSEQDVRLRFAGDGCLQFIQKPYRVQELLGKLKSLIDG